MFAMLRTLPRSGAGASRSLLRNAIRTTPLVSVRVLAPGTYETFQDRSPLGSTASLVAAAFGASFALSGVSSCAGDTEPNVLARVEEDEDQTR